MPITVTWNDGVSAATEFTVLDEVFASLDQFRQAITVFDDGAPRAKYATVKAMIVGTCIESVVLPALNHFPTAAIQAAMANVEAARAALAVAQAAALPGIGGDDGITGK